MKCPKYIGLDKCDGTLVWETGSWSGVRNVHCNSQYHNWVSYEGEPDYIKEPKE